MKEILFRGKTKDNGEWVEGYYYIGRLSGCPMIYENKKDGTQKPVVSNSISEYTGLTDKNGKKIFEGDIVKYTTIRNNKTVIGVVNYDRGCFSIKDIKSPNNPAIDIVLNESDIEVIGNIYDNSELLEVKE